MRLYEVKPGDTPAKIAAVHAGCPKCAIDLVRANARHKKTFEYPNGYVSFRELRVGEKLVLPEKWFTPEFDALPPAYFAALPHPDGVTPSKLGLAAAGVLGDYAALDAAAAQVGSLAALSDQPFSDAVSGTAAAIDASVQETGDAAQVVRASTDQARQRNAGLISAITTGDQAAAFQARRDILGDLSVALAAARVALDTKHASPPAATIAAVAQAAATAISSDPNFCATVAQPGSSVNAAVHAFKTAWNAANPGSPVPINTGTYEQATADAIARTIGSSPAACAASVSPPLPSFPGGAPIVPPQPQEKGLSTGAIVGLGLLGAGAVGATAYFVTRKPKYRVRRIRPRPRRRGHA